MILFSDKKKRNIFIRITAAVLVVALCVGACAIYVNDYYRADSAAIAAFASDNPIAVEVLHDGAIVYAPEKAVSGFIFYPGGKVEHTAYEPLMKACADKGVLCVLIQMPFNLAVLDINAADGIREKFPEIQRWYIGGHSLGGSMAASYLSENTDCFEGLILLGSYSTADLSKTDLDVLSVYGTEDLVLNREKYNQNRTNLPEAFTEVVIDGGCHAGFGMYGVQAGDGVPAITSEEQILFTAEKISALIG